MKSKRNFNLDTFIVMVALCVFLLSLYLLFDDRILFSILSFETGSRQKKIARITRHVNDVRKREKNDLAYFPVQNSIEIYQEDSIFTSADSETEIIFDDGFRLLVSPESLVVIQARDGNTQLEIKKGNVSGKISGKQKISLKAGEKVAALKGDSADLNLGVDRSGKMSIAVLSGDVKLSSGDKTENLKKNQGLKIESSGQVSAVEEFGVELNLPRANESMWIESQTASQFSVRFSWQNESGKENHQLELAQNDSLTQHLQTYLVKQGISDYEMLNLTPGTYYWRIKTFKSGKTKSSMVRRFSVLKKAPPELDFPHVDQTMSSTGASFSWNDVQVSEKYEIQVALRSDFKELFWKNQISEIHVSFPKDILDKMQEGHYFWRVRSESSEGFKSAWSEVRHFQIQRPTHGHPPEVESPLANAEILTKTKESTILFQWKTESEISNYTLEIATHRSFDDSSRIYQKDLNGSQKEVSVTLPQFGTYFWRMRGGFKDKSHTEYCEPVQFKVKLKAPLTAPQIRNKILKIKIAHWIEKLFSLLVENAVAGQEADGVLELQWEPVPEAKEYRVEIARDRLFKNLVAELTTNGSKLHWEKALPGQFYWRVRAVGADGEMSEPSETASIQVEMDAPEFGSQKDTTEKKFAPQAQVTWKSNPSFKGRKTYEFELAKDRKFRNKVKKLKLTDQQLNFDLPKLGTYYWRVRILNSQGESVSLFSEANKLEVKGLSARSPASLPNKEPRKSRRYGNLFVQIAGGFNLQTFNQSVTPAPSPFDSVLAGNGTSAAWTNFSADLEWWFAKKWGLGAFANFYLTSVNFSPSSSAVQVPIFDYGMDFRNRVTWADDQWSFISGIGASNLTRYFLNFNGSSFEQIPASGLNLVETLGLRFQPQSISWDFYVSCALSQRLSYFPIAIALSPQIEIKKWFGEKWWIGLKYSQWSRFLDLSLSYADGSQAEGQVSNTNQSANITLGIKF